MLWSAGLKSAAQQSGDQSCQTTSACFIYGEKWIFLPGSMCEGRHNRAARGQVVRRVLGNGTWKIQLFTESHFLFWDYLVERQLLFFFFQPLTTFITSLFHYFSQKPQSSRAGCFPQCQASIAVICVMPLVIISRPGVAWCTSAPRSTISLLAEDYSIKTLWTCLTEKKGVIVKSFIKINK